MQDDFMSAEAYATAWHALYIPTAMRKMLFSNFNAITLNFVVKLILNVTI